MTNRRWPRNFHHRLTHPLPGRSHAWSERWWFLKEHWLGRGRGDVPVSGIAQADLQPARPGETILTWVGHASYILQVQGKTLLVDPVWSQRIAGAIRRLQPAGVAWDGLPSVDAVLITHNHFDHLDARTVRRLPRHTRFFVPAGLAAWFRRRGFGNVTELDWWEAADLDGLHVEFTPAHHWSRRGIFDTNRSLWGGWVVAAPGAPKVYFSGDTAYGTFFRGIGRRHPDIDVAVLPIGAYAPRATNGNAHTDPEEAVAAFLDLGARVMVPMHWGTFRLGQEPILEPIQRLHAAWQAQGLPHERLADLAIGESRAIPTLPTATQARPPAARSVHRIEGRPATSPRRAGDLTRAQGPMPNTSAAS